MAGQIERLRRRQRRKRAVRARTLSRKQISLRSLAAGAELYPHDETIRRPSTRGDCVDGPRPCPFVACKHHLYLDVSPRTGAIKLNFPNLDPDELAETCALDIADRGGANLERVGELMNICRERVRQIEARARGGPRLRVLSAHCA